MQTTFASLSELKEQEPAIYKLISRLGHNSWYRCDEMTWRFRIQDDFNPYCVAANPDYMTDAQFKFLATEALYREGAMDIPFRRYIEDMKYNTTMIFVNDGDMLMTFEVPTYISGWLNGIYIGVDADGRSNS
jgi:hypothetical protein